MRVIASSMVLALTLFTVGAASAGPVQAGWCPAPAAGSGNDAPSGGWGGGGGGGSRVGRAGYKTGGGGGGVRVAVPSVTFDGNDTATLEKAANSGKPIVVLFSKEKTDITTYFQVQEYVDMKDADAIFIAIPYTTDRTPAPGANETIVPSNKLLGDNPARDYKIRVGEEVVLVLDSFGNFDDIGVKFSKKPTAKELKEAFARMPAKAESLNKKLQKNVDAANTALGKGDRNGAFRAAVKVLESGLVGYGACAEATKIYHSICDEVMGDIAVLKDGDAKEAEKKLGELAGVFTKRAAPTVYAEIDAAKKALKAAK